MSRERSVRRHRTGEERGQLLVALEHSGLTRAAFARQQGLCEASHYRWLRERPRRLLPPPAALIELPRDLTRAPVARPYCLCLPGGVVLEVPPGFVPEEVPSLTQLLRGA